MSSSLKEYSWDGVKSLLAIKYPPSAYNPSSEIQTGYVLAESSGCENPPMSRSGIVPSPVKKLI